MNTKGIIVAAFKELLEQKPFEEIIVQDILDAAGVSRATFYRHFRDKYDIMNTFYLEETSKLIANENDNRKKTETIVRFFLENRSYFSGLMHVEGTNSFKDFIAENSRQYYLDIYRQKYGLSQNAQIPREIEMMAQFAGGGFEKVLEEFFVKDKTASPASITSTIYRMIPEEFK